MLKLLKKIYFQLKSLLNFRSNLNKGNLPPNLCVPFALIVFLILQFFLLFYYASSQYRLCTESKKSPCINKKLKNNTTHSQVQSKHLLLVEKIIQSSGANKR